MVPTDSIRLSSWLKDEVHLAVFVTIERLNVTPEWQGTLVAWWRVTSSEGSKTYKDGEIRITQKPASPGVHPEGVADTISQLVAQMSQVLAQAVRETANQD